MKDFDYYVIWALLAITKALALMLKPLYLAYRRFMGNEFLRDLKVKKAIRRYKKDGRRYRVGFHLGRWRCYHRSEFKEWKRTGFFGTLATLNGLDEQGFIYFDTNTL